MKHRYLRMDGEVGGQMQKSGHLDLYIPLCHQNLLRPLYHDGVQVLDSLFPTELSFIGKSLLTGIISATGTATWWAAGHLNFSGFPINFRIMFTEPRMS